MDRSGFFRRLLFGGAAIFTAKISGAVETTVDKDIYLDSVYIAGFQYYEGPKRERYLGEGMALNLMRQPENPHDFFAVEVYHDNHKLGYLPRSDNRMIARMMDQGVRVKAIIRSIDPGEDPFRRVRIRVFSEMGGG